MCFVKIALHAQQYDNHSRLFCQHNRDDLYDHLMSTQIFTLMLNKILVRAPNMTRKVATASNWVLLTISSLIMWFRILEEVSRSKGYVTIHGPS